MWVQDLVKCCGRARCDIVVERLILLWPQFTTEKLPCSVLKQWYHGLFYFIIPTDHANLASNLISGSRECCALHREL